MPRSGGHGKKCKDRGGGPHAAQPGQTELKQAGVRTSVTVNGEQDYIKGMLAGRHTQTSTSWPEQMPDPLNVFPGPTTPVDLFFYGQRWTAVRTALIRYNLSALSECEQLYGDNVTPPFSFVLRLFKRHGKLIAHRLRELLADVFPQDLATLIVQFILRDSPTSGRGGQLLVDDVYAMVRQSVMDRDVALLAQERKRLEQQLEHARLVTTEICSTVNPQSFPLRVQWAGRQCRTDFVATRFCRSDIHEWQAAIVWAPRQAASKRQSAAERPTRGGGGGGGGSGQKKDKRSANQQVLERLQEHEKQMIWLHGDTLSSECKELYDFVFDSFRCEGRMLWCAKLKCTVKY